MNYGMIYQDLIESRKNMNRSKLDGIYYENHHILPRSMGGTDEQFNMVLLTAKEHWLAHLLLAKISTGQNRYKAQQAVVNMGRVIPDGKRKTSIMYSSARKCIADHISQKHRGTLIVKDLETGIRIGRVPKDHPKVLSGQWVFFHTGMTRSEDFKNRVSNSVSGSMNGNCTGMSNESIIERCVEVFEKYKFWSMNITREYCEVVYGEKVPKSFAGRYREPIRVKNIEKILVERCGATEKQFGVYTKHHTKRILEEIRSGN